MDLADQASLQNELQEQVHIKNSRRPEGPKPTGHCLCCNAPLETTHRWCDADCREDYEVEQVRVRVGGYKR